MVSDVIKTIMKSKGLNNIQMAELLGIKPQSFTNKLFRDSYTVDELIKILDILDCKLIIQPNPEITYTLSKKNNSLRLSGFQRVFFIFRGKLKSGVFWKWSFCFATGKTTH